MKRVGNIYSKICTMDNLREAHKNARKDKLSYREVKMVDSDPDFYLSKIQELLLNETYFIEKDDYSVSTINDKGKERELWKLPYYPHRIIQWAIMLQIEEVFNQVFTNFTCASLPNRGIHKASSLIKDYLRRDPEGTTYCLKIDIHHFYPNINHDSLKGLLKKKFKDKQLLSLLFMIIDSHPPKGIPIGSYLSQYLANFYLSYFDHWLKESLGFKYVVRYMDDVVILHSDKGILQKALFQIKQYLSDNLQLELKHNWQVFPVQSRGIDFVGYRFFKGFTLLRKSCCLRFKRSMLRILKCWLKHNAINYRQWCSINSYIGWLKWCDGFRLYTKYLVPIIPASSFYYNTIIKSRKVASL